MAAKGSSRINRRSIADLEAELERRTAERDAYKAERDEALEQQTATAEVLGVINSSPGDLAPVFDALLEKAMRLCEANLGLLYRFDGEAIHHLAVRGASPEAAELLKQSVPVEPESAVGHLARSGDEVVHNLDITQRRTR